MSDPSLTPEIPDIKVGDVVSLLSGSPRLVVGHLSGGNATCFWEKKGRISVEIFDQKLLEKATSPGYVILLGEMEAEDREFLEGARQLVRPIERDVVTLRSGSFPMTIERIDGDAATCIWFDGAMCIKKELPIGILKRKNDFENRTLVIGSLSR
jgi:uncharacterized protein YodC (DUF2158 family)